MREVMLVAVAGALGTVSRYAVSGMTSKVFGTHFPYGTLAVNLLGCVLLGFLMQAGLQASFLPRAYVIAVTVGFLGAFTTFSTFSYETTRLLQDGAWLFAAANVGANIFLGAAGTIGGAMAGRLVLS